MDSSSTDIERRPLLVDTDGGVDDAAALWWLLGRHDVDVVAVTVVHGNVSVDVAAANVGRILDARDRRDVPIAVGADAPYGPAPTLRPADFIHGTDGLGNTFRPDPTARPVTTSAREQIVQSAQEHEGRLELLTLGPLTNVAHALDDDPRLADRVAAITVMGGAIQTSGNALPAGEANIAHDPEAARRVVSIEWTAATLVGLDVTHRATFTDAQFALLDRRLTDAARFLAEPLAFYRRVADTFCTPGECPCHDLLAAMVAVRPDLVDGPTVPLAVETGGGPAWGATIADMRQPFFARAGAESVQASPDGFTPWRCAMTVDAEAFRAEVDSLFGG